MTKVKVVELSKECKEIQKEERNLLREKGQLGRKIVNLVASKGKKELDAIHFSSCSKSPFFTSKFTSADITREKTSLEESLKRKHEMIQALEKKDKKIDVKLDGMRSKMKTCLSEAKVIRELDTY